MVFCPHVTPDFKSVMCLCEYLYLNDICVLVFQLIAAYSAPPAPPAPPEAADFACESPPARLDFKDSDMKRLSMEIERER